MQILSDRQRQQDRSAENASLGQTEGAGGKEEGAGGKEEGAGGKEAGACGKQVAETGAALSTDTSLCSTVLQPAEGAVKENDQIGKVIGGAEQDSCDMGTEMSGSSSSVKEDELKNRAHECAGSHVADAGAADTEISDFMKIEGGIEACNDTDIKIDNDGVSGQGRIIPGNVVKERRRKHKRVFQGGNNVNGMLKSRNKSWKEVEKTSKDASGSDAAEADHKETGGCDLDSCQAKIETEPSDAADMAASPATDGSRLGCDGSRLGCDGQPDVLGLTRNVLKPEDDEEKNEKKDVSLLGENSSHSSDMLKPETENSGEKDIRMLGDNSSCSSDIARPEGGLEKDREEVVEVFGDSSSPSSKVRKPQEDQQGDGEKNASESGDEEKMATAEAAISQRWGAESGSDMKESV